MTVGSAMSAQAEAARAWKDAVRALAIAEDAFDAVRARAERAYGHGGWETQCEVRAAYARLERALVREQAAQAACQSHR